MLNSLYKPFYDLPPAQMTPEESEWQQEVENDDKALEKEECETLLPRQ